MLQFWMRNTDKNADEELKRFATKNKSGDDASTARIIGDRFWVPAQRTNDPKC